MFKNLLLISVLFAGSGLLAANAIPVLSFNPSSQSVTLGSQASVDVVLSGLESGGLDEILSAFDITVSYASSILNPSSPSVDFTPFGTTPIFNNNFSSGQVQWDITSFELDTFLQGLQGDSVTLGTLVFNTLSAGTSTLSFTVHDLTGLNASALDHTVTNGSITVTSGSGSVPEPTTMMLLGLGALGMASAKRRRKAKLIID